MIKINDLKISFGSKEVVKGVSFDVERGECFGIVGESGSGKSTILRVLSGLNEQWSGQLEIDGMPLRKKRPRAFYQTVQMVFQDPYGSLHPKQTIDRQLSEILLVQGIPDIEAKVKRVLNEVALPVSARFKYPHQLSGGQRQRVVIARALIADPKVLLLDEPTSALDVSVQAEILNLLSDLKQQKELTYILVSHNLSVISHLCPRLGVMQQGEMVEILSADALRQGKTHHPHTTELRTLSVELEHTVN